MLRLVHRLLRAIAPSRCVACDALASTPLCLACAPLAVPWPGACCAWCGRRRQPCCLGPPLHASWAYGGPVRLALQHAKLSRRLDRAAALAWLATARPPNANWLDPVDMVVPIPPSAARLARVGHDACGELAAQLAGGLERPLRAAALRRMVAPSQVQASAAGRRARAAGLYRLGPTARAVAGQHVLLVDDVRTTGATLLAGAALLRAAGAATVRCWVFAAVAPPDTGSDASRDPTLPHP